MAKQQKDRHTVVCQHFSPWPISSVLIDMQHFALYMSLYEYVIIYTPIDHIDQTTAHHCLVTPPLPPPQDEYRDPPFSERGRKSKRSPP